MDKFKKKFIIVGSVLASLFLAIPGTGLAYFYFGLPFADSNKTTDTSNGKINNIKDNLGALQRNEEYTIYFFPSSVYMYEYEKYLSSGGTEGSLPELLFNEYGAIDNPMALEYSLDASGNVSYKATTSQTTSLLSSQGLKYTYKVQDLVSSLGANATVTSNNYEATAYHYLYSNLQYNTVANQSMTSAKLYGDIDSDSRMDLDDTRSNSSVGRYNYIYRFLYDRFGHWPNKNAIIRTTAYSDDKYNGRYSPIKITVNDSLDFKLYNAIPSPWTSMSDGSYSTSTNNYGSMDCSLNIQAHGEYTISSSSTTPPLLDEWFDLSFSNWAYLSPKYKTCFYDRTKSNIQISSSYYDTHLNEPSELIGDVVYEANYLLDPFRSVDCTNIFDLTKDLSYYADEKNVIRLFPIFSNGKSYNATTTDIGNAGISDPSLSHGGLAAARIEYYDNRYSTSSKLNKYYTYNGDSAYMRTKYRNAWSDVNDNAFSWVYYSSVKNFYYDSASISELTFSAASNSTGLSSYNGYASNSKINSFLNEQITNYGDGLYNFYFFYTHKKIASITRWAKTPEDETKNSSYNKNKLVGMGYYDNHILSGGITRYFRGRKIDDYGNVTTGETSYKICGLSDSNYNFYSNENQGSSFIFMNYFLQTSGDLAYYKDQSSEYFTDSNGNPYTYLDGTKKKKKSAYYHNTFEYLSENDLIFMPCSNANDDNGTYYGSLDTNCTGYNSNNTLGYSNIVVAIERVNDVHLVQGDYDASKLVEYPTLRDTYRSAYKQTGTSSISSLTALDPKRTFIIFNQYLYYNEPIKLIDGKSNELALNLPSSSNKLYYDINISSISKESEIEPYNIFYGASGYISKNSSNQYIISEAKNEGTYDLFFYKNDSDEFEVYLYRHALNIKLFANEDFKKNLDDDGFLDLSSGSSSLIWEGEYNYVDNATDKTNVLSSSTTGKGSFSSTSLLNAIKNYASSSGYNKGYIIRDYATNVVIGYYYNGNIRFLFNSSSSGNECYIIKTSVFYLEEAEYTM